MHARDLLPIGELSRRTGIAISAIRYYETLGLISPERNSGGQRRFLRSDIRRLSYILIAREFGFNLKEIRAQMDALPDGRTPTKKDWTRISGGFRKALDQRIARLNRLRDLLDGCIGCGCLSLRNCALYNPDDRARRFGAGPRYVLGDKPAAQPIDS
ncbi:MAG: redox-sensitive transcriptional activator SoxR [Hyphomicrobiales bacterium]